MRKIVGLQWSQTFQPQQEGFQPFPPYKEDAALLAAGRFIPAMILFCSEVSRFTSK